jgi:tetratricopeptide (TPR) repeat protein
LSIGAVIVFWILREKTHLLGDGMMLVKKLSTQDVARLNLAYLREPLSGRIFWLFQHHVLKPLGITQGEMGYAVLSVVFGIASLPLLTWLSHYFGTTAFKRRMFVASIAFGTTSRLFFGYVENYSVVYLLMICYLTAAAVHLHGDTGLWIPSVLFVLLFFARFGAACLGLSLLVLYGFKLRRGRWREVLYALAATAVVFLVVMILLQYDFTPLLDALRRQLTATPVWGIYNSSYGYPTFSLEHALEILNEQLLTGSFALPLIAAVLLLKTKRMNFRERQFIFLAASACGSFALMLVFDCAIGASRDWDVLAPYAFPLILLSLYLLIKYGTSTQYGRRAVWLIVALTLWHSLPYILVNADAGKAVQRFRLLQSEQLWSQNARRPATADLTLYFAQHDMPQEAVAACRTHLSRNRNDGHIQKVLGDIYYNLGDHALAADAYRAATEGQEPSSQAYYLDACINSGALYFEAKRYDDAITQYEKALVADSNTVEAYYNLGHAFLAKHDTDRAVFYWERLLQVSPADPDAERIHAAVDSMTIHRNQGQSFRVK